MAYYYCIPSEKDAPISNIVTMGNKTDPYMIFYKLTAALVYSGWEPNEDYPFAHIFEVQILEPDPQGYYADYALVRKFEIIQEIHPSDWLEYISREAYDLYFLFKTSRESHAGHNSGIGNSGTWNAGDFNSGSFNTGDFNSGSLNTGDFNAGDSNNGCFCTWSDDESNCICLFNQPSDWTIVDWRASDARRILHNIFMNETVREIPRQMGWNILSNADKRKVCKLPNFDADIFYKCTGIRV